MNYGEVVYMANQEALEKVLQHITDNPEQWNQNRWSTCFAGWTVRLIKGAVLTPDDCCDLCVKVMLDGRALYGFDVSQLAQEALELVDEQADALFHTANGLGDLRRLVGEFTAEKVPA